MGKEQILERAEDGRKLAIFKDVKPIAFLQNSGLEKLLIEIKKEVQSEVHDVETEEGRNSIKSLGAKIGKSLKFIEKSALEHARELKAAPKIFDGQRKTFKDFMEALKDNTMRPLIEWEDEKKKHALMISNMVTSLMIAGVNGVLVDGVDTLDGALAWKKRAEDTVIDESFEGSQEGAVRFRDQSLLIVNGLIAKYQKETDDAAKDEEDRLKREAEAKAEYEAKVEREAKERAEANAKEAIEIEKFKAKLGRIEADNAEKQRAAQAIINKDNAVKAESERLKKIADDKEMEEKLRLGKLAHAEAKKKAAALKKSESQKHRNKVRTEIKEVVAAAGLGADAFVLIRMIDEGKIPHITVNYG